MQHVVAIAISTGMGLGILCAAGLLFLAAPAAANDGEAVDRRGSETAVSAELRRDGWKLLSVPGKTPACFARQGLGGIRLSAENGVAFLYRRVPGDVGAKHRLAWRWRVDQPVPVTDLSKIGRDDRSLAVHLVFPMKSDDLPLWERISRAVTRIAAPPLAGKVLTYVWGGIQTRGERLANPHLGAHGRLIVLRSGDQPTGRWFMEEIDFAADFRKAFGYSPPPPIFLAISTDSDDTAGRSLGVIADLVFG
jgi:hypothetical protein